MRRTSGAGAFVGMLGGALIALLLGLGPWGILILGMLGAIIGDYLERKSLEAEERKRISHNKGYNCG